MDRVLDCGAGVTQAWVGNLIGTAILIAFGGWLLFVGVRVLAGGSAARNGLAQKQLIVPQT